MIPRAMLAVAYATGRASHARQVKGGDPDKKGIPWSSRLGVWHGANNPTVKNLLLRKSNKGKSWIDLKMMEKKK
jgi:hypothetical protein